MSESKVPIVAIVGRANVGKSSLFNAILGKREAIVAAEAGTTRDRVLAPINFKDKDFWLVDTAGIKDPEDEFESSIRNQIHQAIESADAIILVVEFGVPPTEEDRQAAKLVLKSKKPAILVVNKVDTGRELELNNWRQLGMDAVLPVSAVHKLGIEELLDKITSFIPPVRIKRSAKVIRIAILGRPNVGKSSLFNSLSHQPQALVSQTAGTTRDVNRELIEYEGQEIELADTAGIRRRGKIEKGIEQFSVLRTLSAIAETDIGLVLMDASELNVQLDQKIAGLVKEAGKGLIIVVNKWDTVDDHSLQPKISSQIAYTFSFVPWAPLVFISAKTGQNARKVLELAIEVFEARNQKIKTTDLNRWLRRAVEEHNPVGIRARSPKLHYITQETDIDMPSFKIFGSGVKFLHWSYRRYLERSFREKWPLAGTPIKFWYIEKPAKDLQ